MRRRRSAPARAKWSCCSTAATAWGTAIAGTRAQAAARDADRQAGAVGSRIGRALLLGRGHRAALDRRDAIALIGGDRRRRSRAPAATRYRAGAEGGGQHPRRVAAAAARGRCSSATSSAAAGAARKARGCRQGSDADAGADSAAPPTSRTSASPACRSRARRSPIRSASTVTAGVANRTERPVDRRARSRSKSAACTVGTQAAATSSPAARASVAFEPFTVRARNMRGTVRARRRRARGRQRVQLRRLADPSRCASIVVDRGNAGRRLYLTRALSIGDAPRFEIVVAAAGDASRTRICGAARSSC